jgi:hypothetical protein
MGVGVLGLPAAWKDNGIVGSLGAMLCLSVISLHCLQLLVDSKEDLIARGQGLQKKGSPTQKKREMLSLRNLTSMNPHFAFGFPSQNEDQNPKILI